MNSTSNLCQKSQNPSSMHLQICHKLANVLDPYRTCEAEISTQTLEHKYSTPILQSLPILDAICEVEINAVIEASTTQQFLQSKARMLNRGVSTSRIVASLESFFIQRICRVQIDVVV